MKYYRMEKDNIPTQNESIEIFNYAEVEGQSIIGVKAESYNSFENEVELTFEEVSPILKECHLNKQFNLIITNRIKVKYNLDDEIALLKKDDTDADKMAYNSFVNEIKAEVNAQKVNYGLKQ
jgi:hypothetical protein